MTTWAWRSECIIISNMDYVSFSCIYNLVFSSCSCEWNPWWNVIETKQLPTLERVRNVWNYKNNVILLVTSSRWFLSKPLTSSNSLVIETFSNRDITSTTVCTSRTLNREKKIMNYISFSKDVYGSELHVYVRWHFGVIKPKYIGYTRENTEEKEKNRQVIVRYSFHAVKIWGNRPKKSASTRRNLM